MSQLIPWAIFCLASLILCTMRPGAGRIVMGLFYFAMAVGVNVVLVLLAPDQFVALGTDNPLVGTYEWFFKEVVTLSPILFGLLAAAYEVGVALLLLGKGRWVRLGIVAGIAHLLVITPLGVWTLGNPIMAAGLAVLSRREYDRNFLDMVLGVMRRVGHHAASGTPA